MGKTFIVAELSANHGHKLETALASVRAIAEAGVDAVKIQTYTAFSMIVNDFKSMVNSIRNVEKVIGDVVYPTDPSTIKGRQFSRSLYIAEDTKAGDILTEKNLRSVRPGYGLHPKYFKELLGKKVNIDLEKGERMKWEYVL